MNSKSPSCDSLNSILTKTNNDHLYRQLKDTSHDFINLDNIDVNLVGYCNSEFINSGYQSLQPTGSTKKNYNILFENSIDIISRYNRQLSAWNRSQEQNLKLDHENEMLLKRQQALKDSNEGANRELACVEEKCRQALSKTSSLNKTIKDLTDENRKLQNTIEQRDKQYKHERKKIEKENNKLKERVQMLTTSKTKVLPNLDLADTVDRGSNGTRATWNTDGSRKQIELYSELIKDYDRKNKELILENNEIKTFLADTYANLFKSTKDYINSPVRSDTSMNNSKEEDMEHQALCEEIVHHPFENIFVKINKEFNQKFDLIKEKTQSKLLQPDLIGGNLNATTSNITISSISSFSTKNLDTIDDSDLLNATFTIDDDTVRQDYGKKSTSGFIMENRDRSNCLSMEKTVSSSTSSSSVSPPSMSLLTEHLETIQNLKKSGVFNVRKCKKKNGDFIEGFSGDKMNFFIDESTSKNNCGNNGGGGLKDERKRLAMEKKYFYEQKLKLEDETNSIRQLSTELIQQKNDFQDEQEKYYQNQLYSSFSHQSKSQN